MRSTNEVADENEFEVEIDIEDRHVPGRRLDPADMAADVMIERALSKPGLREAVMAAGALVVVQPPGPEWVEVVGDSSRDTVRAGVEPNSGRSRRDQTDGTEWREFRRAGTDKSHVPENGNEHVAMAAWMGIPVIGIASAPADVLPRDLMRTVDQTIVLDPPDADLFGKVLLMLFGREFPGPLPAADWALLTPETLRLARRIEQTEQDYVERLLRLLPAPIAALAALKQVGLDQLYGMDEAVSWGKSLASDLRGLAAGELTWSDIDRGALLYGPPGTGKTMFARCLADACGVPLITTSYAAWQANKEGHLSHVIKAMRDSFDQARKETPSLLFIDELDSVGTRMKPGNNNDWWQAIINALLEQLEFLLKVTYDIS